VIRIGRRLLIQVGVTVAQAAERRETPWPLSGPVIRSVLRSGASAEYRITLLVGVAAVHAADVQRGRGGEASARAAVAALAEAVGADPAEQQVRAGLLIKLSEAHARVHAVTGDEDAPPEAVRAARAAVVSAAALPSVDLLDFLVVWFAELADLFDDAGLLDDAVAAARAGLAAGGTSLFNFGSVLRLRFEREGHADDLTEAERILTDAAAISADHGPTPAEVLSELGHVLDLRHQMTGDPADAVRAADVWREAVASTDPADEWARARHAALANALLISHQLDGAAALDDVLAHVREALGPGLGEPDYETCHIAATVLLSWQQLHDQNASERLAEAEAAARRAVVAAGGDDRLAADALDLLARVLHALFLDNGDRDRVDEAVTIGTDILAYPVGSADDEAGRLANLSVSLLDRYAAFGDSADLEEAIVTCRRALAALPPDHLDRARYLTNLSVALCLRYQVMGTTEDLHEAVLHGRAAVAATNHTGIERAQVLSNLGNALYHRYTRFGDLRDLDEDIDLLRQAVACVPVRDAAVASIMSNLATGLRLRHERLGALDDLREALGTLADASRISTPSGVDPVIIDAHGITLYAMGEATGEEVWRSRAIEVLSSAVIGSRRDADLPRRLGNLMSFFGSGTAFDDEAVASRVDAVLAVAEEVIGALPDEDPRLSGLRVNLASVLHARGRPEDTARVIREIEEAIRIIPPDHPDRAEWSTALGAILRDVATRTVDPSALASAERCLRDAALAETAIPVVRLRAGRAWGELAARRGDTATAADAFGLAVEQLAMVAPARLERRDAQRWLADVAGLATSAAAMCLDNGDARRAVTFLELGRGVMLNRAVGIRDDTSLLRDAEPNLAVDFDHARSEVDALDGPERVGVVIDAEPVGVQARARTAADSRRERRRDAVGRLAEVIDRIRRVPGFSAFPGAQALDGVLDGEVSGTVAVVNVSQYRCDAILLGKGGPRVVPLRVRLENVTRMALDLHESVVTANDLTVSAPARAAAEDRLTQVLDELWTSVVGRILDAVPVAERTDAITWLPTGALALLPLHAAAAVDKSDSALDRVVSSYAPTITALEHVRRRQHGAQPGRRPVVVVSSHNDRARPLHHATDEALELAGWHRVAPVDASTASREELLSALCTATDLHLAVHAVSDLEDPSRSWLRLGATRVDVAEVAALDVHHAWLAYISACETTLTSGELADEAIHLTGAFQLAGFPHVVGTLWRIPDAVAARAAKTFYSEVRRSGCSPAEAAHRTSLYLRDRYGGSPSAWAGYVHFGA
jgi:tetratricopeptide (TPR) repeat protein